MKRYFETFKERKEYMDKHENKILDYGVKTVQGKKTYWVETEVTKCKA